MSKRKYPSSMSENLNPDFCEFLMELANFEKNVSRNIHKYNAYKKAASTLANHSKRIESGDEAKKLSGIGEKIANKIDEYLETGKLKKLENIREDEDMTAISLLTRVSGIGPAKAADLVRTGVKNMNDLEARIELLNHHQVIGLKYFEDFEKKIPREEIGDIEKVLKSEIKKVDPEYSITICGSYRRGKAESGDIDLLLTHPTIDEDKSKQHHGHLKVVVEALEKCGLVTDTLSLGNTKFMGVCRLKSALPARRLDIRLTPNSQYHCAVLYFTGSDMFNKSMRAHALDRGFTLNEYTLRPVGATGIPGESVPVTSEEEIFEYIDYPYKKPEERNI